MCHTLLSAGYTIQIRSDYQTGVDQLGLISVNAIRAKTKKDFCSLVNVLSAQESNMLPCYQTDGKKGCFYMSPQLECN